MTASPPSLELCAGDYHAQQISSCVVLFADGTHPTSGYHPFLTFESVDADRPVLALWHVLPTGPVLHVATPYGVTTSFQTTRLVERLFVRDARGLHEVIVRPAAASHAH